MVHKQVHTQQEWSRRRAGCLGEGVMLLDLKTIKGVSGVSRVQEGKRDSRSTDRPRADWMGTF